MFSWFKYSFFQGVSEYVVAASVSARRTTHSASNKEVCHPVWPSWMESVLLGASARRRLPVLACPSCRDIVLISVAGAGSTLKTHEIWIDSDQKAQSKPSDSIIRGSTHVYRSVKDGQMIIIWSPLSNYMTAASVSVPSMVKTAWHKEVRRQVWPWCLMITQLLRVRKFFTS